MGSGFKIWFAVFVVLEFQLLVGCEPQVPCFFIFGDSLVDNGNNNDLVTAAKANYPPYGIDFPDGPTGRFTNGRNTVDKIAELLGFEIYIPPFATAMSQDILKGVNYGSGGAGIRDESGEQLGARISLNQQLLNHQTTISVIATILGNDDLAKDYLTQCLYIVGMGNNDYINNYFLPQYYPTSSLYTPKEYAAVLIEQYSQQLRILYKSGARKVALFGAGQLGCIPEEMAVYGTKGSCVEMIDDAAQLFNDLLQPLVDDLNNNLTDAAFIYVNNTAISLEEMVSAGIAVGNSPCCRVSDDTAKGQCLPLEVPCSDREKYVFFDGFHTTETWNLMIADKVYSALSPFLADPIDVM